jgi:aminobenzoyl-glutamate utilization protein B
MQRRAGLPLALASVLSLPLAAQEDVPFEEAKREAVAVVDAHRDELVELADRVWEYAETALEETRSAALLADYLEGRGFAVERGIAGMPTAFVASYGEGPPVIGVLGEYDALPGISQRAVPERAPLTEGAPGHGCGHNLLGVGALGAALAAKELIARGELAGTVRYYGTPAEEREGGKVYMARDGLFDDLAAAITWHPDQMLGVNTRGSQAVLDLEVLFTGRASHAAFDPWNGRSAVDAAELFTHGINLMREHVRPTVRMHYVVTDAGDVPNVVPEHARVWLWLRDSKMTSVEELLARVRKIAEGAALATETEGEVAVQSGSWEMLANKAGARRLHGNLEWLPPLEFSAEDEEFARALQAAAGVDPVGLKTELAPFLESPGPPEGGSTDVADVSWLVPTFELWVTTAPDLVAWHAWPVVASSRTPIGHQGMLYAARALAATLVDLFRDEALLAAMHAELDEARGATRWKPWVPEGPPPVPAPVAPESPPR